MFVIEKRIIDIENYFIEKVCYRKIFVEKMFVIENFSIENVKLEWDPKATNEFTKVYYLEIRKRFPGV